MSKASVRFIEPWLRKCRSCNNLTVIVYVDDKESTCGACGVVNKISWLPTTHVVEKGVD